MSIPNEVITAFSFLGFILCCIPFSWHLQAWNTGTCLYMVWAGLGCLNQGINYVVWNGNAINWAPVWCDISARVIIGVNVAIPAASLCINRRLYHIVSVRSVTLTKAQNRRAVMVDLAIGLGLPILEMILQYIPQGHRFNIYGDIGCFPFTHNTPVGIAIVNGPPILIGCVSAVYSVLNIRAFVKSRAQLKVLLSGQSQHGANQYLLLMVLAGIEILTIPLCIYAIVQNCTIAPVAPWKGWADTHWGFSRVDQIPSILWRSNPDLERGLEATRIFTIMCAFIFFGFFGFAVEARKNYRSAVQCVAKFVGVSASSFSFGLLSSTGSKSKGTNMSSTGRGATLPILVERHPVRKHNHLNSFSDMSASFADVGGMLAEKAEKPQTLYRQLSCDGLVLKGVSVTPVDHHDGPYSPTTSSGVSSASNIAELSPATPAAAVTRPDSSCIEIASVRYLRGGKRTEGLIIPELAHDRSYRHASDVSPV